MYNINFDYYKKHKRDKFIKTTKEERARDLNNVICPVCKYQNKKYFINRAGICHLCGEILDEKIYFKSKLRRFINGKGK